MKTSLLMAAIVAGLAVSGAADARGFGGERAALPAFGDLDANSDGAVTPEEMQAAMQARAEARFAQADADGDGALSAEEIIALAEADRGARMAERIEARIARADANDDGLLQPEEMGRQEGRPRGEGRMFERFDANDDGSLSAEEFEEFQSRLGERGVRGRN